MLLNSMVLDHKLKLQPEFKIPSSLSQHTESVLLSLRWNLQFTSAISPWWQPEQRFKCFIHDSPQAPPFPHQRSPGGGHPLFSPMGLYCNWSKEPWWIVFLWQNLGLYSSSFPLLPPAPSPNTHTYGICQDKGNHYCSYQTQWSIKVQNQYQPKVGLSGTGWLWPVSRTALKSRRGPCSETPKGPGSLHTPGCSSVKWRIFQI